jgi:hypothetical protein
MPDDEQQQTDDQTADTASSGDTGSQGGVETKVEFSAEQQAFVAKLLSEERKKAAQNAREATKAEADRKAEEERQRKAQEDLKAKGEFEALERELRASIDQTAAERDELREEVTELRAAMKSGLDAQWKALPPFIRKHGESFFGEDDVLGRWGYVNAPATQELITQLADGDRERERGSGGLPRPKGGDGTPSIEDEKRALAARGGYTM